MIYFAHRGASAQRTENTVDAFALAQRQGATCYELDVHLLADGQVAVHHNYTLRAANGSERALAQLTAAQLADWPLANPFTQDPARVPLLTQIFPVIAPGLQRLNIELKNDDNVYPGLEKAVLELVQKQPLAGQQVLFSSFDYPTLQRLRALAPGARIGWLTRAFDLAKAQELGAESVHINQTRLTPQIVDTCHANGLKVFVYTVNDPATAQQLARMGVDGIFTDKIDLFV